MVNGEQEGAEEERANGEAGGSGLTSVPVCGLVEHEHGIVDLRGEKQHRFLARRSVLPRGILPDLSPSQVLSGGSATDGQRGGRRGGGGGRQVTKWWSGGEGGQKWENKLTTGSSMYVNSSTGGRS